MEQTSSKSWITGHLNEYGQISDIHYFEIDGYDELTWSGMDWYAPSPHDDGLSTVTVEDVPPITNGFQPLCTINPLDESDQYGIDLSLRALNVLVFNMFVLQYYVVQC